MTRPDHRALARLPRSRRSYARDTSSGLVLWLVLLLLVPLGVLGVYDSADAQGKTFAWPHNFVVEGRMVQVHAPSIESLSDTRLKGRSRVSIRHPGEAPPSVGSAWFTATISTDTQARLIRVVRLKVDRTQIPDIAPAEARAIAAVIERQVGSAGIVLPLDHVLAVVPTEASPDAAKRDREEARQDRAATSLKEDRARTQR